MTASRCRGAGCRSRGSSSRAGRSGPPPAGPASAGCAAWSGSSGRPWPPSGEGRRTGRPRWRRPVKACGEVTSCTRCRSTASTAGAPGSWLTTWSVQILSTMVRGAALTGWLEVMVRRVSTGSVRAAAYQRMADGPVVPTARMRPGPPDSPRRRGTSGCARPTELSGYNQPCHHFPSREPTNGGGTTLSTRSGGNGPRPGEPCTRAPRHGTLHDGTTSGRLQYRTASIPAVARVWSLTLPPRVARVRDLRHAAPRPAGPQRHSSTSRGRSSPRPSRRRN